MDYRFETNIQTDVEAVSRIEAVNSILEVVCRTTGMGFAAVARVTSDKWIACAVRDEINFGLEAGGELKLETTICNEIRHHQEAVIIDCVKEDERFANHHTPAMYGFQSYISVPIIKKDGSFFGTLCAIDPRPAELQNAKITSMFSLFAELISFHLNAVEELAISEANLLEERQIAELRDQFIAILGHDLRNPVTAVSNAAQLLLQMPLNPTGVRLANIIQKSSYRITGLIDNVLDFARGRMGEGVILNRSSEEPVVGFLNQVIEELQYVWPNRVIETDFNLEMPIHIDGKRVAQLFSNLLSNALTHGNAETPVKVQATTTSQGFTLIVINNGTKIPVEIVPRLFHPFSRGGKDTHQEGLGLGLYISSEIARAHNGSLTVSSTDEETRFTLSIPH